MKELANITLNNGFHLVVMEDAVPYSDSKGIFIRTFDSDDVYNQDLVAAYDIENGEKFAVDVYADEYAEEPTHHFLLNLQHSDEISEDGPNDGTDDEDDDYDEYSDMGEDDGGDIQKDVTLAYGCTGDEVKAVQQKLKELGYFNGNIGGNYLTQTTAAVKDFQTRNGLNATGICDAETYDKLFSEDVTPVITSEPVQPVQDKPRYAIEADWWTSDIQKVFAKGVTAKITDVETGISWYEQRRGGTNHADVQPLTKDDTAKLKKVYGGKWAWTRRAIWVTIGNKTYAASMNGMPHGGSSIKNNGFDGHHCLHWKSSRTHCSNKVDKNHQKMVEKAATTPLPKDL